MYVDTAVYKLSNKKKKKKKKKNVLTFRQDSGTWDDASDCGWRYCGFVSLCYDIEIDVLRSGFVCQIEISGICTPQ